MTPARMQRLRAMGAMAFMAAMDALALALGVAIAALIGWTIGL